MAKPMVAAKIVFNDLPKLRGELRRRAGEAIKRAAYDVEARAKDVVPVDTGNLKNSIGTTMEGDLTAVVGTAVEYAPYVEFGTYKMAARPYLGTAAEAVRPSLVEAMKGLLDD